MATAAMACGERRFGAAYTGRILLALGVLGLVVGLWATQDDPRPSSHPALMWISIGLVGAFAALWIVLGKTVLTISDSGVRRESVSGQQEMAWNQITETRYRVIPINVYAHFGGETVQFGGIGLSTAAVIWKSNSIPVSQITKAELVGSNLQVKRQGKWLAAISVRSDKVPNVLVFLEVLESLAPQVKSTGIDPLARVRI